MAFTDISPNLSYEISPDCKKITFRDTTVYSADPCEQPSIDRQTVGCRSILVEDICAAKRIDTGGTAQSTCLYISGTVTAGTTYSIFIDDCEYSFTTTPENLVQSDEIKACATFAVTGGESGETETLTDLIIFGNTVMATIGPITIGSTEAITANAVKVALTARAAALNLSSYITFSVSGNEVTVCVSPSWFFATYGVVLNGSDLNITHSGTGTPALVFSLPQNFAGGVLPSSDINKQNINVVLNGLKALMESEPCDTKFSVAIDACSANCQIKITSLEPGFSYNLTTQIVGDDDVSFQLGPVVENVCNMPLPVTYFDEVVIDYPTNDTILCATLRLVDAEQPLNIKEKKICFAATCKLECARNKILLSELKECCNDTTCLPYSTRLKNFLDSINNLTCQTDYQSACDQIALAKKLVTASGCKDCNN